MAECYPSRSRWPPGSNSSSKTETDPEGSPLQGEEPNGVRREEVTAMGELTPNIPLLRKCVEWAEAEAAKSDQRLSEWYQEYFEIDATVIGRDCGTAYCIAGYVRRLEEGPSSQWQPQVTSDGDLKTTSDIAADLLGISVDDHNAYDGLFNAANTIEDVRRIADGIAAAAGERL